MPFVYIFKNQAVFVPGEEKVKLDEQSLYRSFKVYFDYHLEYRPVPTDEKIELEITTYAELRDKIIHDFRQYAKSSSDILSRTTDYEALLSRVQEQLNKINEMSNNDYDKFKKLLHLLSSLPDYRGLESLRSIKKLLTDLQNPLIPNYQFNTSSSNPPFIFKAHVMIGDEQLFGVDRKLLQEAWQAFVEFQKGQTTTPLSQADIQIDTPCLVSERFESRVKERPNDDSWYTREFHWLELSIRKHDLSSVKYFLEKLKLPPQFKKHTWELHRYYEEAFKLNVEQPDTREIFKQIIIWVHHDWGKASNLQKNYGGLYLADDSCLEKIKKLLTNYSKPNFGLFLSFHWDRHHFESATAIVNKLSALEDASIKEAETIILKELQSLQSTFSNMSWSGSFVSRVVHALDLIHEEIGNQNRFIIIDRNSETPRI